MKKDYYEIIGLDKNATQDQIKKQYRKLSKKFHPDAQHGKSETEIKEAEEKFKELNEAYSTLSDENKRNQYNQFGHDYEKRGQMGGGMGDIHDIHDFIRRQQEQFFGGFGQRREQSKGLVTATVKLTLEECLEGVTKKFKYNKKKVCSHCNGLKYDPLNGRIDKCPICDGTGMRTMRQGMMIIQQTCPSCGGKGSQIINPCKHCHGSGTENITEEISIEIPIGVVEGMTMPIEGRGNEYLDNNGSIKTGDLIIQFKEIQHNKFQRDGNLKDIHCMINVNIIDAFIGEEITVETLDKKQLKFKLKELTKEGSTHRLNKNGLYLYGQSNERGDLYVHVKYKLPNKLNKKELELLKELKKQENFK